MTSPSNRRNSTRDHQQQPPPSPTLRGMQPLPPPLRLSQFSQHLQQANQQRATLSNLRDQLAEITRNSEAARNATRQYRPRGAARQPPPARPRPMVPQPQPLPLPPAAAPPPPPIQLPARVHYPGRKPSIELRQLPVHYAGKMDVVCPKCSAMHWMCEKLARSPDRSPMFGSCCLSGKISLPLLREPPQILKQLLSASDNTAKYFRENIRKFNNAFAFVSVGVNVDDRLMQGNGGPPVFKANGVCCHRMGALAPPLDGRLGFAQIWIHD